MPGQRLQRGPFAVNPPGVTGIPAADKFVEEAPGGGEIRELAACPRQERVGDRTLEMAVRPLDGPVLMVEAGVVAGRGHAVMGT